MSNHRVKKAYLLIELLVAFSIVSLVLTSFFSYFYYSSKRQLKQMKKLSKELHREKSVVDYCKQIPKKELLKYVSINEKQVGSDGKRKCLVNIQPTCDKEANYLMAIQLPTE